MGSALDITIMVVTHLRYLFVILALISILLMYSSICFQKIYEELLHRFPDKAGKSFTLT